jgi:hypothetical protein
LLVGWREFLVERSVFACWVETIVGGKNFACWEKRFVILVVVVVVDVV